MYFNTFFILLHVYLCSITRTTHLRVGFYKGSKLLFLHFKIYSVFARLDGSDSSPVSVARLVSTTLDDASESGALQNTDAR